MATIPNTVDPMEQLMGQINQLARGQIASKADANMIQNMNGLNTEFSHSNKWIGYFPLANILGKNYSNLELNLTRFTIPQMNMGSTTTTFKGYTYEIPTKLIDADDKEITIEYIVDEKWQNYRALYKWCSAIEGQINQVADTSLITNTISMSDYIPCSIWLIDSSKNRIIDFVFKNCWIKSFGDLALEANNPEEVTHSVTLAYSNFYIEDSK